MVEVASVSALARRRRTSGAILLGLIGRNGSSQAHLNGEVTPSAVLLVTDLGRISVCICARSSSIMIPGRGPRLLSLI